MCVDEKLITTSKKWFDKGNREENSIDKFSYYWIAYNALYGSLNETDKNGAKNFVRVAYGKDQLDCLIGITEYKFFLTRPIKNLRDSNCSTRKYIDVINNSDSDNYIKIENIILCIYQARCNLFHGNKVLGSYDDLEISKNCAGFLEKYLELYFKKQNSY